MESNDILDIINNHNINGFHLPGGTDKADFHSYDNIYANLLSKYRDNPGTILEIGVQYGGSSLLWHEFLPKFNLVMVDIVNQVHQNIWNKLSANRYKYIEVDAFTDEAIEMFEQKYPDGFDIIIEDGPHCFTTQKFALDKYSKLLKKGGTLIIEDIQNFDSIEPLMSSLKPEEYDSIQVYDLRPIKDRWDDLLIVLTK